jgi:hypothetical protein
VGKACSTNEEKRNACKVLTGNPDGKRTLGGTKRKWVDSITIDVRKIVCDDMD